MKFPETLAELEYQISTLSVPADLFDGNIDGMLRDLLAFCHPDRHPGNALASKLFIQVQQLADEARKPPVVLKSPKRQYVLASRKYVGDIADIYMATAESANYLVKVSRIPGAEKLMDRERQALTELHTAAKDEKYRCYFPLIAESFPAFDRFKRRVNVFREPEGKWFTMESVLKKHRGLPARHGVWIFKRLLTALGFAGKQGIVHGAVLPQHILLRPQDHALMLVGWGQSVPSGSTVTAVPENSKRFYPAEALKKSPAKSGADIWMASLVIEQSIAVMSKNMQTFFRGCRLDGQWSRDLDAWDLYDEFDELAKALFGKPRFVELKM